MNGEVQAIDWGAPIEAVHEDGRVAAMALLRVDVPGQYITEDSPGDDSNIYWHKDGSDCVRHSRWRIRNVPTPPQTTDDAHRANGVRQDELVAGLKRALQHPAGDHDGWTDAGMEDAFFRWPVIVNALNEAMSSSAIGSGEACNEDGTTDFGRTTPPQTPDVPPEVVERLIGLAKHAAVSASGWTQEEARAIVALMEPVDPDEAEAARIAMENTPDTFPTDTCGLAEWVLKGLKAGRSLASKDNEK